MILSAAKTQPATQPMANIDAEFEVIVGLILSPDNLDIIRLDPDDFFDAGCREVYVTLRRMQESGYPIDPVTLADALPQNGVVCRAGGLAWIGEVVASSLGSVKSIGSYADILRGYSADRKMAAASNQILEIASERGSDARSKIARADELLHGLAKTVAVDGETARVYDEMENYIKALDARGDHGLAGISTGIDDLDQIIGGLQTKKLYIVGGRPSMGKSSFALGIAKAAAQATDTAYGKGKHSVLFLSQEMPKFEIMDRLVSLVGSIPLDRLTSGKMFEDDYTRLSAAIGQMVDLPLFINDKAALCLGDVRAFVRERRGDNLKVVVIDYLQLMQGPGDNRNAQIETISRGLKQIAMDFDIAVVALSQLSRKLEERQDRRPIPSDLRDSGAVEQDADVIIFVYRDEVYKPDTQDKGIAEIIVGKQRGGPLGAAKTYFRAEYTRFDNYHRPAHSGGH